MKKVSKLVARKAYNDGASVTVIMSKLNPASPWGLGVTITNQQGDFDDFVSLYEITNRSPEVGHRAAFYLA